MSRRKQLEKIFNHKEHEDEEEFEDYLDEQDMKKYKDKSIRDNLRNNDKMQKELSKYVGKKVNYEDMYNDKEENGDELDEEISEDEDMEEDEGDLEGIEENSINGNEDEEIDEEEKESIDEIDEDNTGDEAGQEKISLKTKQEKSPQFNKDQMDKDDEAYIKTITMNTPNEIKKGKNVINQKNLFDFLIGIRISFQKIITCLAVLPQGKTFNKFVDESNSKLVRSTINNIIKLLINLISFQKELLTKGNLLNSIDKLNETNTDKDFSKVLNKILELSATLNSNDEIHNFDEVYNMIRSIYDRIMLISERIVDIWYRKTLVYSFKSTQGNKMLKILNNNFCDHIKKNIESNFKGMREKTMKTSINEKILGKRNRSITQDLDEEIYNDNDFYSYLLKEFISGKEDATNNDTNTNRYDLTLQYLLNRKKDKKNKNVDTRASKCRKLRYDKHEKIINFMVPYPNHILSFGRDEIVRSIFGIAKSKPSKANENGEDYYSEDSGIDII